MQINKSTLLKALEAVRPGLAQKDVIEQSNTFGFVNGKIVTYNDSISIQAPIDLDIEGAVDATKFYSIVNKMKADKEGNIQISTEDDQILIKSKKAKAGLVLQSECKLPLEEINLDGAWKKLPKDFKEGLQICLPSVSNDFSRPIITCISISGKYIRSGDGKQATKYTLDKKTKMQIAIPGAAVAQLLKYDIQEYMIADDWGHFKTSDTIFSCRVLHEEYPDIDHLFDVDGEDLVFPEKIISAIERAEVFSKTDISDDDLIQVIIADGKLTIKGEDNLGWYKEKIKIKSDISIAFYTNPRFLVHMFKTLKKCIVDSDPDTSRMKFVADNWEHFLSIQMMEE